MATLPIPAQTAPQQPDLRAFIVYDRAPSGSTVYPVRDRRHLPLLRPGEWVVADPEDRTPVEGELFVFQWKHGGSPMVVEMAFMPRLGCWAVGARYRGANADALGFGKPGDVVGDFGYTRDYLESCCLGRVIGILEPAFEEPSRQEVFQ